MKKFTKIPIELKRLRNERGITQKKLSEETGISLGSIKSYETGVTQPNIINALKLVRYYGVDYSDLHFEPDNRHRVVK